MVQGKSVRLNDRSLPGCALDSRDRDAGVPVGIDRHLHTRLHPTLRRMHGSGLDKLATSRRKFVQSCARTMLLGELDAEPPSAWHYLDVWKCCENSPDEGASVAN